ncbi:hypothetical protein C8T65DRAFT_645545 [Cerioporus squamosus]|nr:hypothetical protein C8T65DRAFT_645545 [Cerioporus squamosus]
MFFVFVMHGWDSGCFPELRPRSLRLWIWQTGRGTSTSRKFRKLMRLRVATLEPQKFIELHDRDRLETRG